MLKAESAGSKTLVTLMSSKEIKGVNYTEGDNASMKETVKNAISQLSVPEISGWRLPTWNELEYIANHYKDISTCIREIKNKFGLSSIEAFGFSAKAYFYEKDNGDLSTGFFNGSNPIDERDPQPGKSTFIVRAFATVSFNN